MRKPPVVDTLGHVVGRLRRLTSWPSSLSQRHRTRRQRTPWRPPVPWRPAAPWRAGMASPGASRTTILWAAAAAVAILAIAPVADALSRASAGSSAAVTAAATPPADADRAADSRAASRAQAPPAAPEARAKAQAKQNQPAKPAAPEKPNPVAWLNQSQMDNAAIIVKTGQKAKLPKRAYVIAVATAIQESRLLNLANPAVPQSLKKKSQGIGYDHDSVGLFQQRPSSGWGSPEQLLDPEYAASRFYAVLVQIPNWQHLSLTIAAQSVQVSAFPYAYAQHETLAQQIVDAITKN